MILALFLVLQAWAAQVGLVADTRELVVGQTVSVQLQVVDASVRGRPELPAGQGLGLSYQGQSQSRSIVNFQQTVVATYTWSVTALAAGDWTVGPVQLQASGTPMVAKAITIHVRERSDEERSRNQAVAELTATEPYLGQVVVYRFQFLHADPVVDMAWTPPTYDGFVSESSAEAHNAESQLTQDGTTWQVNQVDVPLVAAGLGKRTVSPAVLTAQFPAARSSRRRADSWGDPFMRATRPETFSTDPIPVAVRPLPEDPSGEPFSGLVGQFRIEAQPSARTVALGESITVEVTITGDGTLAGFQLPGAPSSDAYRVYDDESEVAARVRDGRFVSQGTWRRAVVPSAEGRLTIDPIRLRVFDPEKAQYVTLSTQPFEVDVTPGEDGAGEVSSFAEQHLDNRRAVESTGDDILPAPGNVSVGDATLRGSLWWLLGFPALPALALLGLWGRGLSLRLRVDPMVPLLAALDRLPADPSQRLAELERIYREVAGLRLGRPAAGLERAQVAPLGSDAVALYADLEAARYGGASVADLEARVRTFARGKA